MNSHLHTTPSAWWPLTLANGAVVSILVLALGFLTERASSDVAHSSRSILAENVASLGAVNTLDAALADQRGIVANYAISRDRRWLEALDERRAQAREALRAAGPTMGTEPQRRMLERVEELHEACNASRDEVVRLVQAVAPSDEILRASGVSWSLADDLHATCGELTRINEQLMGDAVRSVAVRSRVLRRHVWTTAGAVIVVAWLGVALTSWSVTRRRLASERLALLGDLVATVAHEVRNPLTIIGLHLHALRSGAGGAPDPALAEIEEQVRRLDDLVRRLIDAARDRASGAFPSHVHQAIEEARRIVDPAARCRGVGMTIACEEGLPPADIDPRSLQDVLVNLLRNATQASPPEGFVHVSARALPGRRRGRAWVEVMVRDAGAGVPAADRRRIFEPFFTTRPGGVGLGLHLARRLVEAQGGVLELADEAGPGAAFVVRLPTRRRGSHA